MKIFSLQTPISDAIKAKTVSLIDSVNPGTSEKIRFISHEPTQGEIIAYPDFKNEDGLTYDGAVAVFASNITHEGSSSQTGEQDTNNTVTVDCYGFGSVFSKETGGESKSIESAEKRAQLLVTLAYKAIMDQTELGESFGTGIIISEKKFALVEKVGALGAEVSNRAICYYRATYVLKIEEDVPGEELGPEYDTTSATQVTENPE